MKYPGHGYEAWSFRKGQQYVHCYDYHVFISYTRANLQRAEEIASSLVRRGLIVFFAPESFASLGDEDNTFWSSHLEHALLASCHLVGVLSALYLRKPWGSLELNGFLNISKANAQRSITLVLLDVGKSSVEEELASFIMEAPVGTVADHVTALVRGQGVDLGNPYYPTSCFTPLPLMTVPRPLAWVPWGDGSRHDPDPPYDAYERCVREIMVLILCGADPRSFPARFHDMPNWQERHIRDAIGDGYYLLQQQVSPY